MNVLRAKEIASSPVMADVTCEGVPVYIQHVDEDTQSARIYALNQPENEQNVSLNLLVEH